ncbi:MAG: 50S ribosomal protein L9 [Candidatus Nephrothrix sp. EaCA]|nr:MAG: 50S ribosomal protein L9 [Candidatus Nephrothrix sp. EaCA]
MEVILRQDVSGLGFKNDTVKVRPGYGRNYLIPNGYAVSASDSEKRRVAEDIKQAAHKAERIRSEADALAQKIADLTLIIGTKAGESGKIFGAVTALQVSDALKAKGFDIDRRKISFKTPPKELGTYVATLNLHKEVKIAVNVEVVSE